MRTSKRLFLCVGLLAAVSLLALAAASDDHGSPRSGKWPTVRRAQLVVHPTCQACGYAGDDVQVHHKRDFKSFNPCVEEDSARHLAEVKARPYTKADAKKFEHQFSLAP